MEGLGINTLGLIAQIVNFLIILFVLKKFLYGPFLKVLGDRKGKIQKSLDQVKEIEERLSKLEVTVSEKIEAANHKAEDILNEAKKTSVDIKRKAEEDAHSQIKEILDKAKDQLETERHTILSQVHDQIVQVATAVASQTLRELGAKQKASVSKSSLSVIEKELKKVL